MGTPLVLSTDKLLHHNEEKRKSMGIRRFAGLDWNQHLMRVVDNCNS
jgi:ubiquitin C-terminal hydrolase